MTTLRIDTIRLLTREMKKWFLLDTGLVAISGLQLFVLTNYTDTFFAWTIMTPITAAFLGAAYWGSVPLVYLSSRQRYWSHARLAVLGVFVFTTLTTAFTLIHLDRFHMDSVFGWAWLAVYIFVPPALLVLVLRQLRHPGTDPARAKPLPGWLRVIIGAQAVVLLILGYFLLISPVSIGEAYWPWTLSALTGRAVGAWLMGIGTTAAQAVWENDFARMRAASIGYTFLGVLQLATVARYSGMLDWAAPRTWVYLAFVVSMLGVNLYAWQRSRQ